MIGSNYIELYWPKSNFDDICLIQPIREIDGQVQQLFLNGRFSNNNKQNNLNLASNNALSASVCRRLTLTSGEDLSGVDFVIKGMQNGIDIIETIAGPNNENKISDNYFDYIYNITPSDNIEGSIAIGTDQAGYMTQIALNTRNRKKILDFAFNLIVDPIPENDTQIQVALYGSLKYQKGLIDNLIDNNNYFLVNKDAFPLKEPDFLNFEVTAPVLIPAITLNTENASFRLQFVDGNN